MHGMFGFRLRGTDQPEETKSTTRILAVRGSSSAALSIESYSFSQSCLGQSISSHLRGFAAMSVAGRPIIVVGRVELMESNVGYLNTPLTMVCCRMDVRQDGVVRAVAGRILFCADFSLCIWFRLSELTNEKS